MMGQHMIYALIVVIIMSAFRLLILLLKVRPIRLYCIYWGDFGPMFELAQTFYIVRKCNKNWGGGILEKTMGYSTGYFSEIGSIFKNVHNSKI